MSAEEETKAVEPSKAQLKTEVHELLSFAKQRATALTDGYSVMQTARDKKVVSASGGGAAFRRSTMYVDLRRFTPQRGSEVELQCFNTSMLPPGRFLNADEIANWFMESNEDLNRQSVATFLSHTESVVSDATLESLAGLICQQEKLMNGSFIEALKVFLPISGCLDLALEAHGHATDQQLTLLRAVASAFLKYNKNSSTIFASAVGWAYDTTTSALTSSAVTAASNTRDGSDMNTAAGEFEPINLLVRIGTHVLACACTMLTQPHVQSEVRDEFRQSLAQIDSTGARIAQQDWAVLTAAFEAEFFSGRAIGPLHNSRLSPSSRPMPSFLFTRPLLTGWGMLRLLSSDDESGGVGEEHTPHTAISREKRFFVLTHDALYCFDEDILMPPSAEMHTQTTLSSEGNRFPISTIPLAQCNVSADLDRHPSVLELTSFSGDPLVMLMNKPVRNPQDPLSPWWGVTDVSYRSMVMLELDKQEQLQQWLEKIEEAAWERSTRELGLG